MSHTFLSDPTFHRFLESLDRQYAEETRATGCQTCGGKLHSACYWRHPLGPSARAVRFSFCCSVDGCRRRQPSPSVRFLGRRVYMAGIVVLASAMRHGLTGRRVEQLCSTFGVSERTLVRWRQWWLREFAGSRFWRSARGQLPAGIDCTRLPASLLELFSGEIQEKLGRTLELLSPISSSQGLSGLAR